MAFIPEGVRLRIRRQYIARTAAFRVKKLTNRNFTIISNNCWGGFIYQSYGLPYQTPTIGLFFMADDYVRFVRRLRHYISLPLIEVPNGQSKWYSSLSGKDNWGYPIGRLEDVEIHFLHYNRFEEANEKWRRRCERIQWNNMLIKFNDQNLAKQSHLESFDLLPSVHKVCFISRPQPSLPSAIYVPGCEKNGFVRASYEPFGKSVHLDVTSFLNQMETKEDVNNA